LEATYEKEISRQHHASDETVFNYGWGLVQSHFLEDRKKGILLLKGIQFGVSHGIRVISLFLELLARHDKERELDCYYYLAIGYYKLNNFYEAKKFNDALLERQPDHPQATSLSKCIREKLARDGLIGMGLVAGGAVLIGGLAYLLRRK
jgi:mitochondrial fission 1 protein